MRGTVICRRRDCRYEFAPAGSCPNCGTPVSGRRPAQHSPRRPHATAVATAALMAIAAVLVLLYTVAKTPAQDHIAWGTFLLRLLGAEAGVAMLAKAGAR